MNNSEYIEKPPVLLPAPADAPRAPSQLPGESPLLGRLLKIADGYRAGRGIWQALEIYFRLIEEHPETPEGQRARQAVLEIGELHERNGAYRQARTLYERLL
jgi:hypothetical protein